MTGPEMGQMEVPREGGGVGRGKEEGERVASLSILGRG